MLTIFDTVACHAVEPTGIIVGGNLVINENVDAAIQSMYNVRVKSTDAAGLEIEQVLQLLVQ